MIMENLHLTGSEYRLMKLIWDNHPLTSGNLVSLCSESLGWKKSTTYTVLKRLIQKNIVKNEDSVIEALVSQSQVSRYESRQLLSGRFDGSLPDFIAAFMQGRTISAEEAKRLKEIIDSYKED